MSLWAITTFFNPAGFQTKPRNLNLFSKRLKEQGVKLLVMELSFADQQTPIPSDCADIVVRLSSDSVLWQKERLLNLALRYLPPDCDKVVWLDADILFENNLWAQQAALLLDRYKIVQPYQMAAWLTEGGEYRWQTEALYRTKLRSLPGVAYAVCKVGKQAENMIARPDLLHPGFAWAARRDLLETHGFYDKFVLGGGDFVMMLAMYSGAAALANPSVSSSLSPKQLEDMTSWMNSFYETVAGNVGYVDGTVFHLWHGNLSDRKYVERYGILRDFGFDPTTDIDLDGHECWRWSSEKPELHRQVTAYFSGRKEDGAEAPRLRPTVA